MTRHIELFKILGNKNRREILKMLADEPRYMSELSEELGIGQKAVIDHLRILKKSGLLKTNKGRYNRKYMHLNRCLRAEVFISPTKVETIIEELPRKKSKEKGNPRYQDKSVEKLIKDLERVSKLKKKLDEINRELYIKMNEIMESILDKEDLNEELLEKIKEEILSFSYQGGLQNGRI